MQNKTSRLFTALLTGMACAWAAPAMAQTDTLKIGVVSALTGPGSDWGLTLDGGIKMAAMEANAKGGLKVGDKTYKVEVISYDDQYKAALAVAGVTRLIEQDKVKFIIGPLGSASVLAVTPLYESNKIIGLVGSWSPKTLDKNSKYTYRSWPTNTEFAAKIVDWVKKNKPELKTVAQIEPNDETGWGSQKLLKGTYEAAGYTIVSTELYERNLKDFQPVLTRILATKPDLIELGTSPTGTAGLIVRQARELGYKGQFVKIGGPGVPQIVAGAGKEFAEGLISFAAADSSAPYYKDIEAKYAKVLKPPMNEFTVYQYDIAKVLLAAIQSAGTIDDTDKVRAALEKVVPYQGVQGTIRWGGMKEYGSNHQMLTPVFIGMIKNGDQAIMGRMD